MAESLGEFVRRRTAGVCEYCHLPEDVSPIAHAVDHIIARQHGGRSVSENPALCCGRCNQSTGPNIAGIDPESGQLTRLFHPRMDNWDEHFRWQGPTLIGLSAIGRATIVVLAVNHRERVAARRMLMRIGRIPQT